MPNISASRQDGFQLIELLLVSIIISILFTLATTDFNKITIRSQAQTFSEQFIQSVLLAKKYALRIGQPIKLCPTIDQQNCQTNTNWANGYLIMTNPLSNDTSKVLQYIAGQQSIYVSKKGAGQQKYNFYISAKGYLQNASFAVCDMANQRAILHIISFYSGRVRIDKEKTACF